MEKDMFGVSRLKVNLHMHTTLSDGSKTPEEATETYKKAGYDVVAITDHWIHRDSGEIGGLRILSGAEYNIGGGDASTGVYHILGIGCRKKPNLTQETGPGRIQCLSPAKNVPGKKVWLFYNCNIQILCGNKCFLLTFRTIQRKIYKYCISSDF